MEEKEQIRKKSKIVGTLCLIFGGIFISFSLLMVGSILSSFFFMEVTNYRSDFLFLGFTSLVGIIMFIIGYRLSKKGRVLR